MEFPVEFSHLVNNEFQHRVYIWCVLYPCALSTVQQCKLLTRLQVVHSVM